MILTHALLRLTLSKAQLFRFSCIQAKSTTVLDAALIIPATMKTEGLMGSIPIQSLSLKAFSESIELTATLIACMMAGNSILTMSSGGNKLGDVAKDRDRFEIELTNSHGHRKLGLVDGFSPANKLGHGLHPLMPPRREA